MLIPVYINGILYHFPNEISILEACRSIGIKIPRFCYHENLSIAGNCRMCLVEVNEVAKPIVACSTDILENMIIYTESPMVLKARENILEFLLLNHPLDCPICDQAGECDLQDQAIFFGNNFGRNYFNKRGVEDKNINHIIKTIMTRCIHCTKCVRFGEEICGIKFFGTLNRGTNTEIGNYLIKLSLSEISANVIDLCPVGALTLKTSPFQIRPWEIQLVESIDLADSLGTNIYLTYRGLDLFRVVPKKNKYINESWISNKGRFYFELMTKKSVSTSSTTISNIFTHVIKSPILFLFNSDLDLKTLYFLKNFSRKNSKIASKLLNSTALKTNFFAWNSKISINTLNKKKLYTFFLITTNLQAEMPLLNIRLKSYIKQGSNSIALNGYYTSNFPTQFIKFSILEVLQLIKGTHFLLSKLFFTTENIIFTNKATYNRLDLSFIQLLNNKIKYYSISNSCNAEGANLLNFKKFNLKEFKYSAQIFALGLDDTYFIRKFLQQFSQFFWVNQFPSNILSFLPIESWVNIEINQIPGLYLNLEQRVQKFSLIQQEYKLSILNFSLFVFLTFNKKILNTSKLFLNLNFKNTIWVLNELKESNNQVYLFDNKNYYYSFFNNLLISSSQHFYKLLPSKFILEDPYRTSLQLKYSRTLSKSSQLIRMEASLK